MPSGKKVVTPLFGTLVSSLSLYFGISCLFLSISENTVLAASKKPPFVVVIDPGHGGSDGGTSSKQGKKPLDEKTVSLAIAKEVSRILSDTTYTKTLGRPLRVILTRKSDRHLSLEERSEIGRKNKADLFLSIHTNSEPTHKAQGFEVYFLNNTDDESALKLQEIENRSSKRTRHEKNNESLLLRSVAADAAVDSSREAANIVHSSVVDELRKEGIRFQDRGVKQAMFYVLLDSQVPAVLVEAFYLSHKNDLAFLSQPENRHQIAEGLAKGVLRFLALK